MLTVPEDVVIILLSVIVALGFLWLLRRLWPLGQRREHNDIIGWQVSVLGTTYAVIIGFMLYAVWTNFESAGANAAAEANCLVNVFRLADGLPRAQRDDVQQLASQYADAMLDEEWPAMNHEQLSPAGMRIIQELWTAITQTQPGNLSEETAMNRTVAELSRMTRYRRTRELQSRSKLPGILWVLLILGGATTTLSACLFGTDSFKLHAMQVFSLSLLLSLALVAIGDIDRPFQGAVHVTPVGFERAQQTFAQVKAAHQ